MLTKFCLETPNGRDHLGNQDLGSHPCFLNNSTISRIYHLSKELHETYGLTAMKISMWLVSTAQATA